MQSSGSFATPQHVYIVEFVGALVGVSGAVGEGVGDVVGDGDGDGVGDGVVGDGVVGAGVGVGVGEGVGEFVGDGGSEPSVPECERGKEGDAARGEVGGVESCAMLARAPSPASCIFRVVVCAARTSARFAAARSFAMKLVA
jgi:hypothetical protein